MTTRMLHFKWIVDRPTAAVTFFTALFFVVIIEAFLLPAAVNLMTESIKNNLIHQVRSGASMIEHELAEKETLPNSLRFTERMQYGMADQLWVASPTGELMAHPTMKNLVGTDVRGFLSRDGVPFFGKLIEEATAGNRRGFIEFDCPLHDSYGLRKVAYAEGYPSLKMVIGASADLRSVGNLINKFHMASAAVVAAAAVIGGLFGTSLRQRRRKNDANEGDEANR